MKIEIGKLAGFCGGVINSVTQSEDILNEHGITYCLGELVHNTYVVAKLEEKGLKVVNSLSEVPDNERVIIRAHGVPNTVYEEAIKRNLSLYDLTCPKVLKVHEKAKKMSSEGCFVILIAQKDHPEAIGTISFCGEDCAVLENENQLDEVVNKIKMSSKKKVSVISQTTFSVEKFNLLTKKLNELLGNYELLVDNTICSATELRQKETRELASRVNAMIIIGGKNSSNTKKLFEVALKYCDNIFIIESLVDLKQDMSIYDKIGIMAGASTPKESIDEVVIYLESINK